MIRIVIIVVALCAGTGAFGSCSNLTWTNPRRRFLEDDRFSWISDVLDNFDWIDATDISDLWDSCAESANTTSNAYVPVVSFYEDPVLYGDSLAENRCSANEEEQINDALDAFQKCADFDLQSFLNYFPAAVVGSELDCVIDNFTLSNDLTDTDDLSETCAESLFGANAFGDAVRSLFLHPDVVLPCFERFSRDVPSCNTQATRSIPVAGPWLQIATCVVGAAGDIVDNFCSQELIELNQSLPNTDSNNACEDNDIGTSLLLSLPRPLLGAPLPDACQRYAEENEDDYGDLASRYESFQENCAPVWSGWENDSTIPPSETESQASIEGTTGIAYPPSSIAWAFFGGMAAGLLVIPTIRMLRKRKNAKVESTAAPREANIQGKRQFNSEDGELDDVQFT